MWSTPFSRQNAAMVNHGLCPLVPCGDGAGAIALVHEKRTAGPQGEPACVFRQMVDACVLLAGSVTLPMCLAQRREAQNRWMREQASFSASVEVA